MPWRAVPALPEADPLMGEIRWDRWEKALALTHVPDDCETCGFTGPLRTVNGKTLYTPKPSYVRVAKSTQTKDGRSRWQQRVHGAYWAYTHWARFCPACDEMAAYRRVGPDGKKDWTEIFYHPHRVTKNVPPQTETLF